MLLLLLLGWGGRQGQVGMGVEIDRGCHGYSLAALRSCYEHACVLYVSCVLLMPVLRAMRVALFLVVPSLMLYFAVLCAAPYLLCLLTMPKYPAIAPL